MAADVTGKWSGSFTAEADNQARPAYIVLRQDGAKLTGSAGQGPSEQQELQNGKVDENGVLSFEVMAGDSVIRITLKQDGEELKGQFTRERDGQTQKATLALKREK